MREKDSKRVAFIYLEFGKSTMSQNSLFNSIIAKLALLDVSYYKIGKIRANEI